MKVGMGRTCLLDRKDVARLFGPMSGSWCHVASD
jgi:hypothetical protein